MRRSLRSIVALSLIVCILCSGCGMIGGLWGNRLVSYEQMEYTRPDMVAFAAVLEESCSIALQENNIRDLESAIWDFYAVYDDFYTNFSLAMIAYSRDLTDIYWEEEYSYCTSQSATVDAGLDRLYRCLAQSPLRNTLEGEDYFGADYFDSFEGESVYDQHLTDLLEQEALLRAQYQSITAAATDVEYYSDAYFTQYGSQMEQLYLDLVMMRQEISSYLGYEDYLSFAYEFYHIRDYTPQQAMAYLADVRAELVPLYCRVAESGFWSRELEASTEEDSFRYVKSMAQNMGGTVAKAFSDMASAGVYDISYGENKYPASFELYLTTYYTPYIFLSPTGTSYDKLTFAHEFGHFCSDYVVAGGSMQSVDVAEIFSQAMEYFSILYAEDSGDLKQLKMADCLSVFVEQAAYASFEHQVYLLPPEELTVESIRALYEQICIGYGLDTLTWDGRDYVCIPHFFENPLYLISYVISNDAALQLYQMELSEPGSGIVWFEENLASAQPYFLAFVEEAGLESPFATGRLIRVRQTLEEVLQ